MIERYIHYDIVQMIKDYEENVDALSALRDELKELEAIGVPSIDYSRDRVQTSPDDEAMIRRVIRKEDIETKIRGYEKALALFDSAWAKLTGEERFILGEFYQKGHCSRNDAIETVSRECNYERTSIYRKRGEALDRLLRYMFG
jgi:hypothetical protein